MEKFIYLRKSRLLLLTLLALLVGGVTPTWADNADFENALPEGWEAVGTMTYYERAKTGSYSIGNAAGNGWDTNRGNYIKTTALEGDITLWLRSYKSGSTGYVVLFKLSDDGETVGDKLTSFSSSSTTFAEKSYTLTEPTRLAIVINYAHLDNMTYTPYVQADGPALAVKDGSTNLTSPYAYNFGLATAGTTKTFTLSNPGTEALGVSVSETGNFGATLSATTIAAGGEVTLTVTMPEATGNSAVTITPAAGSGIDPFVINVSGTIRDANKVYLDFADGTIPDGWTSVAIGSYASNYGSAWAASTGYVSQSGSSSSYEWAFTSPKLNFTEGETILFETEKYSSSTWYTPSIKVEYSIDNSTWTTIGSAYTDDVNDTWASRSVTIPTADAKYIRFSGWYIKLRNIYGGELPTEPKFAVTAADYAFGVISENTTSTEFTISNSGKATLTGVSVASSNSAFTVSSVPTSIAAGESATFTVTMSAATTGAQNGVITVSAEGFDAVTFNVSGVVLPEGLMVVDFNDNTLPAGWGNNASNKWSFDDGKAYCTSAAELTTPKLQFAEGDMLVIKATSYDDFDNNYIEITGSTDGSDWTALGTKKFVSRSQIPYGSYGTLVVTDIPTTVKYLKFKGYYVRIDEIAGLTYAPVLTVTESGSAVSSPAAYDFGEAAADATVTYNFANTGAGTINVTNVAITGDGAAAYSTNWTESVAAPFDLVITRTYDADRTEAQEAVVNVTTSEGAFVINVTGTDKAANAPELAVSTNAIDFSKVTADAVETVTVTNNGTGSMTVNIASDSEDFVVSAAQLTEIGAGESKDFTVTFKYGTPYGVKGGNITVTPTYDETAAQTITVTGKANDPDVWAEDFAANELPTGWDAGSNWSIADGVAKASYAYGSTSYLTTPTLTVSNTTDELTFDYKATANYVSIKIQMSKDGAAFADYKTISGLNNGDAATYTITDLEAGDYQFRFANDDYQLDNFEGFKLNLPDHMATISASSIPTSGLKEGQSFDATVTVKEQRGVAEALTAKLYMGTEVIGTATGNVAAKGTETLTITATPTTGADNAEMHIEVEYAGGTLSTDVVNRTVTAITYLTLDETSSDAVVAGTYDNVTLKRTFAEGWNTVCLPFTVSDVEAFFGTGAKAYNFSSYTDGVLGFTAVTELTASYPYIVYVPAEIKENIELNNITIASGDATAFYRYQSGAYFRGTYAPIAANGWTKTADTDNVYGVTSAATIAKAGASTKMSGFRAYFDLPAGATARLAFTDEATGITRVMGVEELAEGVYNLQGQRVENMKKGLYIVNGKKTVRK